ncbi:hypothetical protein LWI29_008602 [Acer saccharum]|uniref:Uncharacterized protein n=1 Tax=Acer saccharum TaxID=4024 RepID=A0AA39VKQ3_ACESA|nr:hypothetical protein LWI29_008602 [Acer saccharum]
MEYLKPTDFYEQIFKDISRKKYNSKPGRFLCFDVNDKYVSLAVSDWKNKTAAPLRALDRQENNSTSNAADLFQSLTYLDDMNKMVDGSNNKSIMRGTSAMPSAAMLPSSSHDTVPQMEYIDPLDFFKEIFKDILRNGYDLNSGQLLGLHVSEKYVSFSMSDWKNKTVVPLRALDRQENNLTSSAADLFQSLISEHNIVGIVVGTSKANLIVSLYVMIVQDYLLFAVM